MSALASAIFSTGLGVRSIGDPEYCSVTLTNQQQGTVQVLFVPADGRCMLTYQDLKVSLLHEG